MRPRFSRPVFRVGWLLPLTFILCLCARPLEAETFAGKIDSSFNSRFTSGVETQALAVAPIGEIFAGGNFDSGVVELETNGSADPAFQFLGTGTALAYTTITSMAVQPAGGVIVSGYVTPSVSVSADTLVRLNADGTVDSAFVQNSGENGEFSGPVNAVALQPDGKILVGGSFSFFVPGSGTGVVAAMVGILRLNSDGSPDLTFNAGTGVTGTNSNSTLPGVNAVALQPDGKVLLVGNFTTVNGTARADIARLNADGSLDTGFDPGSGCDGTVYSVALQADGKILLGGSFTAVNGASFADIARLNADGSVDTGFNPGSGCDGAVNAVAVQGDGRAVLGGAFTMINNVAGPGVARLNADGSRDLTFGPDVGLDGTVTSVIVQSDGTVLLGGAFNVVAGIPETTVTRLHADGSVDSTFSPNTQSGVSIMSLAQQPGDGKVIVGGIFAGDGFGVTASHGFVRLLPDGSFDPTFQITDPSLGGIGQAVVIRPDSEILVAINWGDVAAYANPATPTSFPGPAGEASASADGVYHPLPQVSTPVKAPVKKYPLPPGAGHHYTVAAIAALRPDGSDDPSFPLILSHYPILAMTLQPDGQFLVGTFGGSLSRYSAEGSSDVNFTPDASLSGSSVSAMAVQPADGKIVAGYYTYNSTDTVTTSIARLNTDGSLDGSFATGTPDGSIQAIALQADGEIVVGGSFQIFDAATAPALVRLNADGSLDAGFAPGVFAGPDGTLPEVASIQIQADGRILVAGQFASVGGVTRNNFARLNADGSLDATLDSGDGGDGVIRSALLLASGEILMGGDFSVVNGAAHAGVAQLLNPATPPPQISPPGDLTAATGQAFSVQVTASNLPATFAAGGLPAGITIDPATGLITGTPATPGNYQVTITVENAGGLDTATFNLTVVGAPIILPVLNNAQTVSAQVGVYFIYQIIASNAPTSFGASGLPAGLNVNTMTGLISGAPTAPPGSYPVTLSAGNAAGTATGAFTLILHPTAPTVNLTISGTGLAVEGGANGVVVVSRTGDTSAPLVVFYRTKGAAVAGVDYKPLPGKITIPAGAAKAKIKVKPIDGSPNASTRKLKLQLLATADGSYVVGVSPVKLKLSGK